MSSVRGAPPPPADPASAAAAAALAALRASATASAAAKYAAGPGARKRPRPAGPDEERRARKTRSAYMSRFSAAAYTTALEAACAAGEAARAAAEAAAARAREEHAALHWAVLCAENELLRRSVGELQAAVDGDVAEGRGGAVVAAERDDGDDVVAAEWAWAPAPAEVPAEPVALGKDAANALPGSPMSMYERAAFGEDAVDAELECTGGGVRGETPLNALPSSPVSAYESAEAEADVADADADGDALLKALLLIKEEEWESTPLPDVDRPEQVDPVGPITAA